MSDVEKVKELLKKSSNGVITTEQISSAGLHRSALQKLVERRWNIVSLWAWNVYAEGCVGG